MTAATAVAPLRIGVIGVGRIGRMHAELIAHQVPGAALGAVQAKADATCAHVAPVAGATQDQASALKYRLWMRPGNLQVDRMPGPGPAKTYTENFSFIVSNPGAAEWDGHAPSCQTMDIVVTPVDKPDEVVWQWSHGQMFCMHVTDIKIAAGVTL